MFLGARGSRPDVESMLYILEEVCHRCVDYEQKQIRLHLYRHIFIMETCQQRVLSHVFTHITYDSGDAVAYKSSPFTYVNTSRRQRERLSLMRDMFKVYYGKDGAVVELQNAEDPRLFRMNDRTCVLFTRYDKSRVPSIWMNCGGVSTRMRYGDQREPQKNWIPLVYRNRLYVSYSLCPHIVLQCFESGHCMKRFETRAVGCTRSMRGTSSYAQYGSFLYAVSHTRSVNRTGLYYEHSIYVINSRPPFAIYHTTPSFIFPGIYHNHLDNIQFCTHMNISTTLINFFYTLADATSVRLTCNVASFATINELLQAAPNLHELNFHK